MRRDFMHLMIIIARISFRQRAAVVIGWFLGEGVLLPRAGASFPISATARAAYILMLSLATDRLFTRYTTCYFPLYGAAATQDIIAIRARVPHRQLEGHATKACRRKVIARRKSVDTAAPPRYTIRIHTYAIISRARF